MPTVLHWLALAGLGVAALAGAALALVGLSNDGARDGGRLIGSLLAGLPFGAGLLLAAAVALWRGGFDGLGVARPALITLVMGGLLAGAVVAVLAAATKTAPRPQVPWALWPLRTWLPMTWPLLLLAGVAWGLWPARLPALPPVARGALQLGPPLLSLLLCALMLLQWAQHAAAAAQARVSERLAFDQRRDDMTRRQVMEADPVRDLVLLLPQTSRFEQPDIRTLALQKLKAHPDLGGALAALLRHPHREAAFVYLDSNEPPDAPALAAAVHEGLLGLAEQIADSVQATHTLQADDFHRDTERLLAVADRFQPLGVDARPAVLRLRAGLRRGSVQGRAPALELLAAVLVDDWLRRHPPPATNETAPRPR
jgi:hypothetical protein